MALKKLRLNPAQRVWHNVSYYVKRAYNIWGRGTGKSSYGIGTVIRNQVHFLPRSKFILIAESFKAMLQNTLPSTIRGLEGMGYYRDVHYVIGVRPPKSWPLAYEPPLKGFSNTISWFNGASQLLVSQDSAATSPRGLNVDGCGADESANLDKEHYDEEVAPTIRANQDEFRNVPFHLGEFFFGSMPYGHHAEWFTEAGKYYQQDGKDYKKLMDLLITAQLAFLQEQNMHHKEKLWYECVQIRKSIKWYSKRVDRIPTFYQESNTFDNIGVMGYDYINKLYTSTSTIRFMTEIMNKRMGKVEGAFYSKLDTTKHTYKRHWSDLSKGISDEDRLMDALGENFNLDNIGTLGCIVDKDCMPNLPLRIGVDFGGNINSLVVGQKLESLNRFNFIKDFYVKTPDGIDELADLFIDYYKFHPERLIYMHYDSNGNNTVANSRLTYAEQFAQKLRDKDWTVLLQTSMSNPLHDLKYRLWGILWGAKPPATVAINYYNCQNLIFSIQGVKTKEVNGQIKKDKSGEGKNLETEEREPHLSDAADYVIFPMFKHLLNITPEEFHDNRYN